MYENIVKYGDYSLFATSLKDLPNRPKIVISTINQYSFCLAEKQPEFKQALLQSDVLLPDGVGILAALKLHSGHTIKKISGSNLHYFLLDKLNKECGSCFYLGASESTLSKIKARLALEYPKIKVGSYSPPYKAIFSAEDSNKMVAAVNRFAPVALFVGMTAPKQEKWVISHKEQLDTKIISSIGAVFDFYSGTINRPKDIWIRLGFEWFVRLINEPKRMWKRYLYYGPVFVFIVLKYKIRGTKVSI